MYRTLFSFFLSSFWTAQLLAYDLMHFAADDSIIEHAACQAKEIEEDTLLHRIQQEASEKLIDEVFLNTTFKNQPINLMHSFKKLLTHHDLFGRPDRTADIAELDDDPIQAAKKIFGDGVAEGMLYLHMRYGFNSSHLAWNNSQAPKKEELAVFFKAIRDYPSFVFSPESNKKLARFTQGMRLAMHSENTIAFADISFYDLWTKQTPAIQRYTAFHELAHYIGQKYELDGEEWKKISGWVCETKGTCKATKNIFVSLYAQENPAEDFAESVCAFRYNPKLLLHISPEKYHYIKELVFEGIEYLNEEQCSNTSNIQDQINKQQQDNLAYFYSINIAEAFDQEKVNIKEILDGNNSSFDKCIKSYVEKKSLRKSLTSLGIKNINQLLKKKTLQAPLPDDVLSDAHNEGYAKLKEIFKTIFSDPATEVKFYTPMIPDPVLNQSSCTLWSYAHVDNLRKHLSEYNIDKYSSFRTFDFFSSICLDLQKNPHFTKPTAEDILQRIKFYPTSSK